MPPPDSSALPPILSGCRWGFWKIMGAMVLLLLVAPLFFIFIGIGLLFALPGELAAPDGDTMAAYLVLISLATYPAPLWLCWWFARRCHPGPGSVFLGFSPIRVRSLLPWVGLTVLFIVLADGLNLLLDRPIVADDSITDYLSADTVGLQLAFLISVGIMAPLVEEVVMRGFLLEAFRFTRLRALGATVLTAVIWGALHQQYDLHTIITICVFGLLLGYARLRTNSLYPPLAMHALNNFYVSGQVLWAVSGLSA